MCNSVNFSVNRDVQLHFYLILQYFYLSPEKNPIHISSNSLFFHPLSNPW